MIGRTLLHYTILSELGAGSMGRVYLARDTMTDRRVAVKVLDLRAGWRRGPIEMRLLAANVLNYMYNLVPQTLAPVRTVTVTAVWSH